MGSWVGTDEQQSQPCHRPTDRCSFFLQLFALMRSKRHLPNFHHFPLCCACQVENRAANTPEGIGIKIYYNNIQPPHRRRRVGLACPIENVSLSKSHRMLLEVGAARGMRRLLGLLTTLSGLFCRIFALNYSALRGLGNVPKGFCVDLTF